MTIAESKLLRALIEAEREYRDTHLERKRWVEIGRFVGIDPRTARALEAVGLIDLRGIGESHGVCLGTEAAFKLEFDLNQRSSPVSGKHAG